MAKFPLDLSKFKKVSSDQHTTTLRHPHGHTINIATSKLDPKMRKHLDSIPIEKKAPVMMAEGGYAEKQIPGGNGSPAIDPDKASAFDKDYNRQMGAKEMWQNVKNGLSPQPKPSPSPDPKPQNYANGGMPGMEDDAIQSYNPLDSFTDYINLMRDSHAKAKSFADEQYAAGNPIPRQHLEAQQALGMATMGALGPAEGGKMPGTTAAEAIEMGPISGAARKAKIDSILGRELETKVEPLPGTTTPEAVKQGVISPAERDAKIEPRLQNKEPENFAYGGEQGEANSSSMPPVKADDLSDIPTMSPIQQQIESKMEYLRQATPGVYANDPDLLQKDAQDQVLAGSEVKANSDASQAMSAQSAAQQQNAQNQEYNARAAKFGLPLRPVEAPQQPMQSRDLASDMPPSPPQGGMASQANPGAAPMQMPSLVGGYNQQLQGIDQQQVAQSNLGNAQAHILKESAKLKQEQMQRYEQSYQALEKERIAHIADIKNGHIDPDKYWENHSKVAAGLGILLAGFNPTNRPNAAIEFVNHQVDQSIQAQAKNLESEHNLLQANLHQFGNLRDATTMTKLMMNDIVVNRLDQEIAKSQDPLAKSRALILKGQLQSQQAPQFNTLAARHALAMGSQQAGPTGGAAGQLRQEDPAAYVPLVVPEHHQAQALKEIKMAQDTNHMGKEIMQRFDQAAQENTVLKTGAGMLRTPGSVHALHQAMQPTFADLEGTVRQAAMDNTFDNITPKPGDSAHTIETKRQALGHYLESKASAPTAKAYGIDLGQFQSTSTGAMGRLNPQQQKFADYARKNPQDPKSAMMLKKLGIE